MTGPKLLALLAGCDLKVAAFNLVKGLSGGVYRTEVAVALDRFVKLPCPETAVSLVGVLPDALTVITNASEAFIRSIPPEARGPRLEGFDEWLDVSERTLRKVAVVHSFLSAEAAAGRARIGFHRLRDQAVLVDRLAEVGFRKGLFASRRQFLRDKVMRSFPAYRAVIDMVCVHGVLDRRERFWTGFGENGDGQLHLRSEVLVDVGLNAGQFASVVRGACE
jgi:hypothetical protein